MNFKIRRADFKDATPIAKLHTRVWRETYKHIAPESALNNLDLDRRTNDWNKTLAAALPECQTFVAVDQQQVLGFIHIHTDKAVGRGTIQYLYIDQNQKRRGIGRALMRRAFSQFSQTNCAFVELSVVQDNDAALGFYQSLGGRVQEKPVMQGYFWRSKNWIISWDDLGAADML